MTARGCVGRGAVGSLVAWVAWIILRLWEGTDTLTWGAP